MKGTRIEWIDNCRGLCLLFVIVHHIGMADVWFLKLYLPIFLTCFFFISGYLFINPNKQVEVRQKLLNIFTSLLIPYAIYCLLTAFYNFITGGIDACITDALIAIKGVKSWFISALVLMELMACVIVIAKKHQTIASCLFVVTTLCLYFVLPEGTYIWNFRNALLGNVYFGAGILCRRYDVINVVLKNRVGIALSVLYLIIVALDIKMNLLKGNFNETFSNYPFFFIASGIGVLAFIYTCSKIKKYNGAIMFVGANSLLYYYLQSFVIRGVMGVYTKLGVQLGSITALVAILLATCIIIWPIVLLVNRYFPVMSGKYRINVNELK